MQVLVFKGNRGNESGQTDSGLDVALPDGPGLGGHLLPCCATVETSSLPSPAALALNWPL